MEVTAGKFARPILAAVRPRYSMMGALGFLGAT